MPEENEIEEFKKGSKTTLIIIIAVVVNIAIVAVVVVLFASKGSGSSTAAPSTASTPVSNGQGPGPIVEMPGFVVNIKDEGGAKYLKAGIVIELANEALNESFIQWQQILRNEVLIYLSNLDASETRSAKQKRSIEARLKSIINERVGTQMVSGVYFTEFVTQ